MKRNSVRYEEGLRRDLAEPEEAAAYLNAALEDGSKEVFLMALRDVAEARGIAKVARESLLNRENIYRILSTRGNPQLTSLKVLLDTLGLKLAIEVRNAAA
jgi:probable addiction module antidote protein